MTMDGQPGSQQQYPQTPKMSTHGLLKVVLILVALIVVAALLTGGYESIGSFFKTGEQEQLASPPEGLLVLAAAAKFPDSNSARIFPAKYDFGKKEFDYVPADKLVASPDGLNLAYQHMFSNNSQYVTFVGATDIENITSFSDIPTQIYRADVSNAQTYEEFTGRLLDAEVVTKGTGVVRQNPSVSNFGEIVYTAHESNDPRSLFSSDAEKWSIHYVTGDGKDTIITQGIFPKWVGDDLFIFLKNDGLYLYSLADKDEQRVWGMHGTATMNMSLEVSDDFQYIAWTVPDLGTVYVFRALNWSAGNLALKGTIAVPAVSAVFSPDTRFIAVEMIAPGETPSETQVLFGYYDVETLQEMVPLFTLANVDANQTRMSDWRP